MNKNPELKNKTIISTHKIKLNICLNHSLTKDNFIIIHFTQRIINKTKIE